LSLRGTSSAFRWLGGCAVGGRRRHPSGGSGADEVGWVDQLLVTVPTRLVADLAGQSVDGEHLAGAVVELLDRDLADRRGLALALAPYAHRYGGRSGDGDRVLDCLLAFGGYGAS
jgi:hypothetical protein